MHSGSMWQPAKMFSHLLKVDELINSSKLKKHCYKTVLYFLYGSEAEIIYSHP